MLIYEEWKNIANDLGNVYIFGTGIVGRKLYQLLVNEGYNDKIKGFVVSKVDKNEKTVRGCGDIPVIMLEDAKPYNADILVSVSRAYHPEVFEILENSEFNKVIAAHKFYNIDLKGEALDSSYFIDYSKDKKIDKGMRNYRNKMIEEIRNYRHAFGDDTLYQSFPTLGIKGRRPTETRISEYDLKNYIGKNSSVLDIGCNIGFIDLELSCFSGSILGIEYNNRLVELAQKTADALKIDNCKFIAANYNEWIKSNTQKFDVILSFAVHAWLGVEPKVYAKQIQSLLNNGGYFVFESQTLNTDAKYEEYVEEFVHANFHIVKDALIMDDGTTERRYLIFKNGEKNAD